MQKYTPDTHTRTKGSEHIYGYSICARASSRPHTHTHTGEGVQLGQVLAISQHINHPPLNNLSVVLTV